MVAGLFVLLVLILLVVLFGVISRSKHSGTESSHNSIFNFASDADIAEQQFRAQYAAEKSGHQRQLSMVRVSNVDEVSPIHHSNLSAAEVLFLWYLNGQSADSPRIAMYWRTTYGLTDYQNTISRLMRHGFLTVSSDPENYLNRLTVAQLRDLCEQHGFAKDGKKQYLQLFLAQRLPQDALDKIASENSTLVVTPSGQQAIAANRGLLVYHKHKSQLSGLIDLSKASAALRARPHEDPLIVFLEAAGCSPRDALRRARNFSRPLKRESNSSTVKRR